MHRVTMGTTGSLATASHDRLILPIIQKPDERLRKRCAPVEAIDNDTREFISRLTATRQRHNGLGLAAPQVGRMVRIVSLNPGRMIGHMTMINPEIVRHGQNQTVEEEGCLSIDMGRTYLKVKQWDTITVRLQTIDGAQREVVARGLGARIVQHELDHLDGKMIDMKAAR